MKKPYLYAGIAILLWSTMATVSKLLLGDFDKFQVLCIGAFFVYLFDYCFVLPTLTEVLA